MFPNKMKMIINVLIPLMINWIFRHSSFSCIPILHLWVYNPFGNSTKSCILFLSIVFISSSITTSNSCLLLLPQIQCSLCLLISKSNALHQLSYIDLVGSVGVVLLLLDDYFMPSVSCHE